MNTAEKRIIVQQWIEKASDEVVDVFYDSLLEESNETYNQEILEELDRRRQSHLDGMSPSYSWEQVKGQLNDLRMKKYGS